MLPLAALAAAVASSALLLQGCGSAPGPSPTAAPTSAPTAAPTPAPTPAPPPSSYDGSPPFYLEDVGMKGFSYNPLYLNDPSCLDKPGNPACTGVVNDDVSAPWAKNMWSPEARGDIKTLATLGANAIRLYGNDPRFSKKGFFDEMLKHNMKAVTGLSNWPFTQQVAQPKGCIWTGYDCYAIARDTHNQTLVDGGFAKDGYYHNAIEIISIMNEPDINAWVPGAFKAPFKDNYVKGLLSAFDGILTAEKNAGIKPWKDGRLPKLTIAWSYATPTLDSCGVYYPEGEKREAAKAACHGGIGWMVQFYGALQDPEGYLGYKPKNDLKKAYRERFILALQPFQTSESVLAQAIKPSQTTEGLKDLKLYLGEYNPAVNICNDKPTCAQYGKDELEKDIRNILTSQEWKKNVIGLNFFQFQLPYQKYQTHELAYGMVQMTKDAPWRTGHIEGDEEEDHPINCLTWRTKELGEAVAAAYNGTLPAFHCPSPNASLDESVSIV